MQIQLWKTILLLRQEVLSWEAIPAFCCIDPSENKIVLDQKLSQKESTLFYIHFHTADELPAGATHFLWKEDLQLVLLQIGTIKPEELSFVETYLPYCFYSLVAKKRKRAISVAHFAQTLDGKIATSSGHSKWIGNKENLKHAHRMRALCDAILIGRATLDHDRPKLTVRHVEGNNPARIVLGSKEADYSCLFEASDDPVLVISSGDHLGNGKIKYHKIPSANGRLQSQQILSCLFEKGFHSVYIEGGSLTTSNFVKDQAIDTLQLHLSPQIFGSGQQGIQLPEINKVGEAIQFSNFQFRTIGDTQMFVGQVKKES